MNKILAIAILIIGCGLLYYGWQAHESVASTVSTTVTGSPTDKSLWLLGGGVLVTVYGLYALFRSPSN